MSTATPHLPSEPRSSEHRPSQDRRCEHRAPPGSVRRVGGRRSGYAGSVVVNLVVLGLVNTWPGWEAVPFLTTRTALVIGVVNASIVARLVADLVNLLLDLPRPRALGDVVSLGFGIAALVRIWQVFPLDVVGTGWEVVARVLLAVGLVGSAVGVVDAVTRLFTGRFPGTWSR